MADKNAHITELEALSVASNIQRIARSIEQSSNDLNTTTDTLISGALGEEIEAMKDVGKKLIKAIGVLSIGAFDMGYKIGEYINAMIANDKEAASRIKNSL